MKFQVTFEVEIEDEEEYIEDNDLKSPDDTLSQIREDINIDFTYDISAEITSIKWIKKPKDSCFEEEP